MIETTAIKEKKLVEYKNRIDYILYLNDIEFDCDYEPSEDPNLNSKLCYYCLIKNRGRAGEVCNQKDTDKFGGIVLKTDFVEYLEKEGFEPYQIEDEGVWMVADSPEIFVTLLAYPFHKELIFDKKD